MASADLDASSASMNSELVSKKEESPVPQDQKKKKKQKDLILKDIPQHLPDEQKLQLLCERLYESQQEQKNANTKIKQYEQLAKTIKQERDVLQNERNRLVLQKDKLETLCRELQKQNKIVQDESLARIRAEDEKRREVADHFQTSITSIQTQLNEYQTRNLDLRKENQDLADKLGEFIKQHERREEHMQKIMQTRELEVKLAEAKVNKMQCQLDQERVKAQQQLIRMEEEAKLMKERMDMHISLENKLKEQIEFYKTKYKSFNKTMADSNRLFDSAKEEMEKLGKRVRQAERDVVEWRGKWELSQRSLLELVEEHKKKTAEAAASKKQADRLAGLCRALQGQLLELRKPSAQHAPVGEFDTSLATAAVNPDGDALSGEQADSEVPAPTPTEDSDANQSTASNSQQPEPVDRSSSIVLPEKPSEEVTASEQHNAEGVNGSPDERSTPVNESRASEELTPETTEGSS